MSAPNQGDRSLTHQTAVASPEPLKLAKGQEDCENEDAGVLEQHVSGAKSEAVPALEDSNTQSSVAENAAQARSSAPATHVANQVQDTSHQNQLETTGTNQIAQIQVIRNEPTAETLHQKEGNAFLDIPKKSSSSLESECKNGAESIELGEVLSSQTRIDNQSSNSSDLTPATPFSSSTGANSRERDRFAYMIHDSTSTSEQRPITEGTFNRDEINSLDLTNEGNTIVIFLPRLPTLLKQEDFVHELIDKFGIDSFYLTQTAYDSNGFFRGSMAEKSVGCRFLVKELNKIDDKNDTTQFDQVRQELYDLIPEALKVELEKKRSISTSNIVSLPDDPAEVLVEVFVSKFNPTLRDRIADRMLDEEPRRREIESSRWFKKAKNPSVRANDKAIRRRDTGEAAALYSATHSLPPNDPKVHRAHALAAVQEKKFFSMIRALAKSQDPDVACGILRKWMLDQKNARLVLQTVIELGLENKFKFLGLIDEILVTIYHRSNCILEQIHEPNKGKSAEADNQTTKPTATAATKMSKSKSDPQAEPDHKCRDIKQIYHWFFFFFWIRAFNEPAKQSTTQVLLCFDDCDSPKIKGVIRQILSKGKDAWNTPEKLFYCLTEQVISIFDTALWGFRVPVREIEKQRSELTRDTGNSSAMYFGMHELLRHLIHSQETLAATEGFLEAALAESTSTDKFVLRFCLTFVKSLKLRAGAFVQRLNNELSLAYHINNAKQLEGVDGLLKQSQDDGRDIAKFVGYATIFFLPGTFISGFFSMTFFGFNADRNAWAHSSMVWVWFVVTVPITAIGILLFSWRHSEKTFVQFIKSGLDKMLFLDDGQAEASDKD